MKSSGKIRIALIEFGQQKTISEDQIIQALALLPDVVDRDAGKIPVYE